MPGQLTLLDAPSLWYRAFHGVPETVTAPDGTPVNAVRGTVDLIARIVKDTRPARLVACLDLDWRPAFRVAAVPSYKAHRLTANGAEQARAFLTALSPTATWGVVEATRKAQDVGSWTRALGGVHALALTELEETSDPAAVLELGIPVSRLGGRPATPRAWATLLTGRLAA